MVSADCLSRRGQVFTSSLSPSGGRKIWCQTPAYCQAGGVSDAGLEFRMNLEKYRQAIHNKVCLHCITLGENGRCTLTGVDRCGVELYLEEIVRVVHSINSPRLEDYVEALRKHVCSKCQNQNPNGTCSLRNQAECGLDRYFALAVEAIEEVDQKKKKKF